MDYAQIIGALLGVVDKVLEAMPDYEQRKREKYFKLKKAYLEEMTREDGDDNLADNLRDELKLFIESFSKELSEANIQVLQTSGD
jgi:hypothetical protein